VAETSKKDSGSSGPLKAALLQRREGRGGFLGEKRKSWVGQRGGGDNALPFPAGREQDS